MWMIWKSLGNGRLIRYFGGARVRAVGAIPLDFLVNTIDIGMFPHCPRFSSRLITIKHFLRFVRMASDESNANRTVTFADPPSTSRYVSTPVPIAKLNSDIMDVEFVKVTDALNYPGGLTAMMKDHHFGSAVPLGRHWAYKYVLDLDGMSYSGRFMAFLASDSAVVKATVYDEYFSDWIQPWCVHPCLFDYSFLRFVINQAPFHTTVNDVQGNLQYPRLFFWTYAINA
jgi:hypothetical protein